MADYSERMFDDPAATAWRSAGCPAPTAVARQNAEPCGRCGDRGPTVRSAEIISESFTGFDQWAFGVRRLCTPCAWSYSAFSPTTRHLLTITSGSTIRHRSGQALGKRLIAGPLPADTAVVVSVSAQHYVLPHAQWGGLVCDRICIDWTSSQAHLLKQLAWLRTLGFDWSQLKRSQPTLPVLRKHPVNLWPSIGDAWKEVRAWHSVPALWAAARLFFPDR